ncbi:MAG: hypothetical protein ACKPJJ_36140, partial [Planctomycetaceae bacterium]
MTETGGQARVWTALRATAALGGVTGFSEFSILTADLGVQINTAASDKSIIKSATSQYGAGNLQISFGSELRELTGTALLDIAGDVQVHGGFAFSQSTTAKTITVSKGTSHTTKSVTVTTFGFSNLSAFFGAGPY